MQSEKFIKAEMEIFLLISEDIVTTSPGFGTGDEDFTNPGIGAPDDNNPGITLPDDNW